jgi:hypothetical protein
VIDALSQSGWDVKHVADDGAFLGAGREWQAAPGPVGEEIHDHAEKEERNGCQGLHGGKECLWYEFGVGIIKEY